MTKEELKQYEEALYEIIKGKVLDTLIISKKCYQKVKELEELYYMVDNELVLAALNTAQAEQIKAFDTYRFWLMQAEEHKTGE